MKDIFVIRVTLTFFDSLRGGIDTIGRGYIDNEVVV
jgi:hypothetical protein